MEMRLVMDKREIALRFFECHSPRTPYQLAKLLGVHPPLVYRWHDGNAPVPWHWLKMLVDEQGLCWDWLIDGKEPKYRNVHEGEILEPLDRHAINQRFLSLFPGMSQAQIGEILGGINPGTVYKWRHDIAQVPWDRLKYAVENMDVTWEWLIEGR